MRLLKTLFASVDWWLISSVILLTLLGLATMYTFDGDNSYFQKQIAWIGVALVGLCIAIIPDYRFLRQGNTTFFIYLGILFLLVTVLFLGETVKGAQSRFDLFFFSLQPSDPAKLVLIAILAKYFSKRHELIGDFRHILVSGTYALLIFGLVFIQPDFGSAIILFSIWFGMVLVAGISFRHLAVVGMIGVIAFMALWNFGFQEYQKQRIMTFLHPLADIRGTGYNAYQSTIAVGSGQLLGKGVGYGTQSKLQFLPEYETDFIFAAFAEEWGLVGSALLFFLFSIVIWRLLYHAVRGATNFERLFAVGVAILITSHFFVHIGMNIGLLPVTGTTVPFLSYGGSHLFTEFLGIGVVIAMARYTKQHYIARELIE
ncbi:MAG: rod shape-determining protein RodA [Candidatus Pacebacteria bacterium]|nr:rod shape-determining protein RodA [Candidatus Paceibacterota bacterium]MCF7856900.1 rod shape-determining protein RodA [Candidatus Paceibacterota bacterium]